MTALAAPPLEDLLVLACARPRALCDAERRAIRDMVSRHPDWASVVHAAAAHGLTYLLATHLTASGCAPAIPQDCASTLRRHLRSAAALRLRQIAQAGAVLRLLHENGIDVVVCKGLHLSEAVYFDGLARLMADTDLLLHERDLPRAFALLSREAFAPPPDCVGRDAFYASHHHVAPLERHGLRLELHRHLFPAPWAPALAVDDVWRRTVVAEVAGERVRVLSPEDLVLHVCVHALVGRPFRHGLRPLCDIAAIVERYGSVLDWAALIVRARVPPIDRAVFLTLGAARRLLGVPVPPDVLPALHVDLPADFGRSVDALILAAGWPARAMPDVLVEGARDTSPLARFVGTLRRVFPPPATLRALYGRAPTSRTGLPLLYVWRPFDLLVHRGPLMAQFAGGMRGPRAALERQRLRAVVARWLATVPAGTAERSQS